MLQADTTLVNELGMADQIREDFWAGTDWIFPALRINVIDISPSTDGSCHLTNWRVTFSIIVVTQPTVSAGSYDASPGQSMDLVDYTTDALFGEKLESSGNFICETRINVVDQTGPMPESPAGGWRAEVFFEVRLQTV